MTKLPQSKTENIVVQNLENEVLIYDLEINKAFCLNETSAVVYQACNGNTDFEDFKRKYNLNDEIIFLALDLLKKESLLEESFVSPFSGMKRRDLIKKAGLATMIALPIVIAISAPTAVMAAASCGGTSAPGTVLGCTALESQCLNMNQMCASCATTAVEDLTGMVCAVNTFICTCN